VASERGCLRNIQDGVPRVLATSENPHPYTFGTVAISNNALNCQAKEKTGPFSWCTESQSKKRLVLVADRDPQPNTRIKSVNNEESAADSKRTAFTRLALIAMRMLALQCTPTRTNHRATDD